MAEEAQPVEGAQEAPEQGQGSDGNVEDLYDLQDVSPELREQLLPHLQAISKNVDGKFREAAEYRQQWQPYEELGVNEIEPDQLAGLMEFAQLSQDPDQFADWWEAVGDELGLFDDEGSEETEDDFIGDAEAAGLSPEEIQQLVSEQVAQATEPLYGQMAEREQEARVQQAHTEIMDQLSDLKSEHNLDDEDLDTVLRFAYSYDEDEPDPVGKGFEDFQRAIAKGERGMFEQKNNQPKGAEGPGQAAGPEPITSMEEAKAMARERMRQAISP